MMTRNRLLIVVLGLVVVLACQGPLLADPPTVNVYPSSAPNAFGSPSWAGYLAKALYAIERDQATNGSRATDPTAYERAGATISPGDIAVTSFNSWRGQIDPPAPFANESGNRLHFGLHIVGGGTQFRLSDLTFSMHSSDPDDSLVFEGDFIGYSYNGTTRYGIDWGADRVKGGGDDAVCTSGDPLVDEIVYVGVGNAWWPAGDDPDPSNPVGGKQKAMDDYLAWVIDNSPLTISCSYSVGGATGSASVDVVPALTYTVSAWGPTDFPGPYPVPAGAPHLVDGYGYPGDKVELKSYTGTLNLAPGTYDLKINTLSWSVSYTYAGTDGDWTNDWPPPPAPPDWVEMAFPIDAPRTITFGTGPSGPLSQMGLLEVNWDTDYLSANAGSTHTFFVGNCRIDVTPLAVARAGAGAAGVPPWIQTDRNVMARFVITEVPNLLTLDASPTPLKRYVKKSEVFTIDLDVSNLLQMVKGCQAFMGYESGYLTCTGIAAGSEDVWNDLIWGVFSVPGEIDTAVGVYGESNPAEGTLADGTVAKLTLQATTEGTTQVVFRPNADPDPGLIESTFLSDMLANIIWPSKIDSQLIVIDGTAPTISIDSAKQSWIELLIEKSSTTNAVQGVVNITVTASDALAGLAGPPTVTVRDSASNPLAVSYVCEVPAGTFYYTALVTSSTANGIATINATVSDKSGNSADDTKTFNINKHEITGQVELEGFVAAATSRAVTFVATGGETRIWTLTLTFTGGVANYQLVGVPAGTNGLSAKTAWNLRRKLAVSYTDDRAVVNFTGSNELLGGDLNGSNSVNVLDYTILKTRWLQAGSVADIDGDGEQSVPDYTIMRLNWFKVGDPQ